ncbi:MAG: hypothetical protein CME19_09875 [Gemmatimonadetes bacterium]|nr:hypothetical protein [Gemmatimonadota bacterium]|tara:strand:- start:692 stop:1513 length:822 start_codon:yes stop_codon:yes gene_type:complete
MKVSILQPPYPSGSSDGASVCLEWILDSLAALPPQQDFVLLPEYANVPGLSDQDEMRRFADQDGARFLERISGFARERSCAVAVGTVAEESGIWLNRTLMLDRSGEVVYHYDKIHLTEQESGTLELVAGDRVGLVDLEGATVGFATCFDVYFPELFAAMLHHGVDIVLSPSYQRSEIADRLRYMSQTRAVDCDAWFLRSSYSAGDPDRAGRSLIVAPDGEIVVDAGSDPGVITADIEPDRKFVKPRSHGQPDVRHGSLMNDRRRPEVYTGGSR